MTSKPDRLSAKFKHNAQIAVANRRAFKLAATTVISLVGSAGSGKTSLIEAVVRLAHHTSFGAIIGNLASQRDAERLQRLGVRAIPVITDNLTAEHVQEVLGEFDLNQCDVLFIESSGNTESPVEFDFGQTFRAAAFSVAGGDDKAAANPRLVADADLVVLTKSDLLPFVTFDLATFLTDVTILNPEASILTTASLSSHGFDEWVSWLSHRWTSNPSKAQHKFTSRRFLQNRKPQKPMHETVFRVEGER